MLVMILAASLLKNSSLTVGEVLLKQQTQQNLFCPYVCFISAADFTADRLQSVNGHMDFPVVVVLSRWCHLL
jgi:hypothetical protein